LPSGRQGDFNNIARMATQSLEDDPELKASILDIDHTPSHIATLLAAQANDQERYALAERIIIEQRETTKGAKRPARNKRQGAQRASQ
jgi:hypothetical protein